MKNICVFGDSLVYGLGDVIEGGWVTRLEKKINSNKLKFFNFGIPGDTSRDLLNRISDEIKILNPDMIIVFIGANDSSYYTKTEETLISQDEYKKNIQKIFSISKKYTSNIIFLGLPRMDDSITTKWNFKTHFCNKNLSIFDNIIKNFCKENKIKYIPTKKAFNKKLLTDGAHPNPKGYHKLMNLIEKEINFKSFI